MKQMIALIVLTALLAVSCKTNDEDVYNRKTPEATAPAPANPGTNPGSPPPPPAGDAAKPPVPAVPEKLKIDHSIDFQKGEASAPVVIEYFADLQCGACKQMAPILDQFMVTYPGKIRLIFKNFPKDTSCTNYSGQWLHEYSCEAAVAARCVGHYKNKFWEYKEEVFTNQAIMDIPHFKSWALALGLTEADYDSCIANADVMNKVKADVAEGISRGVVGTPTIYVNGVRLYPASQANIDAEIKKNI